MTLYLIGLGLNYETDITLHGLMAIKTCDLLYLDNYTSVLKTPVSVLEKFYGKKIKLANRKLVESSNRIIDEAKSKNVGFLVVGDVFSATTHTDLYLRAKSKNIDVEVVHNTSIMTAIGIVGLQLYNFGKTTSMPYFEKSFFPESPYEVIRDNKELGMHTLVLLDIKQNKYMTVNQALKQLLQIEKKRQDNVITDKSMVIGCARIGRQTQQIKFGKIPDICEVNFGDPLHCLIIPGKIHFMEEEMLKFWE